MGNHTPCVRLPWILTRPGREASCGIDEFVLHQKQPQAKQCALSDAYCWNTILHCPVEWHLQEITSLLLSGQLDAAWICGFPFVANHPRLALVAVPHWQGKPLYRSYLITDRDRQVGSPDDLTGDVHAISDPDINSGWLVTVWRRLPAGT